jgi:hypothetical protein
MAKWTRQPQEEEGNYHFSGMFAVTAGVDTKIPKDEILQIYQDVLQAVREHDGLDYLQVYQDEKGTKLFFIDATPKDSFDSGDCDPNDPDFNNCVLCFPSER